MAGIEKGGVPRVRALGRYELFAKLGSGGMAEVHLARQRGLKRFRKLVVVKTVHPQLARDERFIDLLLEEARISALLKHPRVVDIYDVSEEDGTVFIAMEYLPGQSITEIIKAGRKGEKIDVMSAARIIADAAEGLDAAHNLKSLTGEKLELVHRDVSPGNIIVLYSGDVKIVDFGVAKAKDHLTTNTIGKFAGKLGYAAPEQLRNDGADRRSDVFSLGVVFWELLCHRRLFLAKSREQALELVSAGKAPKPSSIRKEVPPEIDALVLRALDPDPAKRFSSAKEMFTAIEEVLLEANYRRESDAIAGYMDEMFADQRAETELLVRRAAEATNQISIAELAAEDAPTAIDEAMPEKIAAVVREEQAKARADQTTEVEPVELLEPGSAPGGVGAIGTAPGASGVGWWQRARGLMQPGHPWRRPLAMGMLAVVGIALAVVVVQVAKSGASTAPAPSGGEVDPAPAPTASVATSVEPASATLSDAAAIVASADAGAAVDAGTVTPTPVSDPPPEPTADPTPEPPPADDAADDEPPPDDRIGEKPEKKEKERDRDLAKAKYLAGMREVKAGRFATARKRFKEAIRADSRYAPSHRGLGIVYQLQGANKSAARSLRRYLKMRPNAKDAERIRDRLAKLEGR